MQCKIKIKIKKHWTAIDLSGERARALGEVLKVNTTLTELYLCGVQQEYKQFQARMGEKQNQQEPKQTPRLTRKERAHWPMR